MQDKTEAPTQKRRTDAREEGRVAKSTDVTSAVVMLVSLLVLKASAARMFSGMKYLMTDSLSHLHSTSIDQANLSHLFVSYGSQMIMISLPILATTVAVGLAANVLQVGLKVTPKAVAPKFSNMNPMSGLAKLFSVRGYVELLKSILKVAAISWFGYQFIRDAYPQLIDLGGMSVSQLGAIAAGLCWSLMMKGCMALFIIGAADYIYQKFSFEKTLKMTKQEVIEEFKQQEGDPKIKGQIKQRMIEMSRRRMMQEVPKADVVITNPTHFAVAIRYDGKSMSAPTVVAKGQRLLALKIRELAEKHGVPIVENPPVARLLYKTVEIGKAIPEELFQAVAEILAYVYQMNKKSA